MHDNILQSIQTAYTAGQFDQAGVLCARALIDHPGSGQLHNLAAAIAAKTDQLELALEHAHHAIELVPDNPGFHLNIALIQERSGQIADALASNERVLTLRPEHPAALANLANLARLQHRDSDALELYARAAEAAPNDPTLLANWASLLGREAHYDLALEKIDRALTLQPGVPQLMACRADILSAASRMDDAIAEYARALRISSPAARPAILSNLAVAQLQSRHPDALASAAELEQLDPGNRTAAALRYIHAVQQGDLQTARREMDVARYVTRHTRQHPAHYASCPAFLDALRSEVLAHPSLTFEPASKTTRGGLQSANLVPDAGPAIRALHDLLLEHVYDYLSSHDGETLRAARDLRHLQLNIWVTVLDQGGHQLPHIHPGGVISGVFYVAVPDPNSGAIEFGQPPAQYAPFTTIPAHRIAPEEGDVLLFPSQFYHRTLAFGHAERRISIAFDVIGCPLDAGIPADAVRALAAAGQQLRARDFAGAWQMLGQLLQRTPNYAEAWAARGQMALQSGDHDAAHHNFTRATQLRPLMPDWWFQLGVTEQHRQNYPDARTALDRALHIDPAHENARMTLASLHTDLGAEHEALRAYRAITSRRASAGRAWYGLSLQQVDALDDADIKAMHEATGEPNLTPADRSGLHFALGRALEHRAQYDNAFTHFAYGNKIKRTAQPFDPTAEWRNCKAICRAFTPEVFTRFAQDGNADDTPVLIVGMPRSGSTLVEQILANHPDVRAAGESNALWRTLSGIDRYLPPGKTVPADIASVDPTAWRELGQNYLAALRVDAAGEARRITDKLPFNYTLLGMLRLMLPNAWIVDARRHPMDCCWSCFATSFGVDRGFSNDLVDLGVTWRSYDHLMTHWHKVMAKPIHTVQYETMIADNEATSRALLAYLELDWHDDCLNFHRSERAVITSSFAQVRQPIYSSSVDRWRRFETHLGPLRDALGDALDDKPNDQKDIFK